MSIKYWLLSLGAWGITGCGLLPTAGPPPLLPQTDVSTLPPCVDDDCNCGDFRNQALAQAVLTAFPQDPFRLDADGNGVACESLPPMSSSLEPTRSPSRNPHLLLGNPSQAGTGNPNNWLVERSQYALSYNRDRGTANWVSWQLNADWLGETERQDNFRQDGSLPKGVYQVTPNDYRDSGFDRGHLVPSGDRTGSPQDNAATFLMTNIVPQAPEHNRGIWRELEAYSRDLVRVGDLTLVILAGGYGEQAHLANGRVTVPSRLWKIIVVLDPSESALTALPPNPRVIAVDMPNRATSDRNWRTYQTTVDRLEVATGYDFFDQLPTALQEVLEANLAPAP
jgi:endonuclease G